MHSTLHLTTKVLPGKRIDITSPELSEGETVNLVIRKAETNSHLNERRFFLSLPMEERRRILKEQATSMVEHYNSDHSWREIQNGDIVEY